MTRDELVTELASRLDAPVHSTRVFLHSYFDAAKAMLRNGEPVEIDGLGVWDPERSEHGELIAVRYLPPIGTSEERGLRGGGHRFILRPEELQLPRTINTEMVDVAEILSEITIANRRTPDNEPQETASLPPSEVVPFLSGVEANDEVPGNWVDHPDAAAWLEGLRPAEHFDVVDGLEAIDREPEVDIPFLGLDALADDTPDPDPATDIPDSIVVEDDLASSAENAPANEIPRNATETVVSAHAAPPAASAPASPPEMAIQQTQAVAPGMQQAPAVAPEQQRTEHIEEPLAVPEKGVAQKPEHEDFEDDESFHRNRDQLYNPPEKPGNRPLMLVALVLTAVVIAIVLYLLFADKPEYDLPGVDAPTGALPTTQLPCC